MNSRSIKKIPISNYSRSWNLRSKLYLVNCFYASLLMISFEDLILIFCIWVHNLTIEVIVKKYILNNILLLLIGVWLRKSWLPYTGALSWSTLLCLHPVAFKLSPPTTRMGNKPYIWDRRTFVWNRANMPKFTLVKLMFFICLFVYMLLLCTQKH
jgi:hypothetical protein